MAKEQSQRKRFNAATLWEKGLSVQQVSYRSGLRREAVLRLRANPQVCNRHKDVIEEKNKVIENLIDVLQFLGLSEQLVDRLRDVHRNDLAKPMAEFTGWLRDAAEEHYSE